MILGDSLQVMASLAEREGLRGQVQCIYLDPPYGIKFNSNFQWSTTSRDVKDGKADHITREPEQVKAFRDTWRDGIHSYLTYLRDRLTVARDLLHDTGSIFVQIGDENVHRVRAVMDEVFGTGNLLAEIPFKKTSAVGSFGGGTNTLPCTCDYVLGFAKSLDRVKFRQLFIKKNLQGTGGEAYKRIEMPDGSVRPATKSESSSGKSEGRFFRPGPITSITVRTNKTTVFPVDLEGSTFLPGGTRGWSTNQIGMSRVGKASRLMTTGKSLAFTRYLDDYPVFPLTNLWADTQSGSSMDKTYVVQTNEKVIQRCLLMATDPGDLVLDPTCGSGTTAYVAEQWGRRWITIDTSRVALALARARIMGARYPYYLLADSADGAAKEAELSRHAGSADSVHQTYYGDVRQGFVYERVPHITLKSIANNAEIDVIWDKFQHRLEPLREKLNKALGQSWEEWEIPREADDRLADGRRSMPTAAGGNSASCGRRRSTPPSPPRRTSSTSTTSPTRTRRRSASPDRSRSRACRPIASWPSVRDDDELIDPASSACPNRTAKTPTSPR
jgi:adenine-specific DNA-methyltransferase